MLFNSDITLFIFGWDDLSIGQSGILKSPLPLLWGSVWNFTYSRSCFMNCMHLCLGQRLEPQCCLGEEFLWFVCRGLFITSFGWQSILSGIRIERSCLLHHLLGMLSSFLSPCADVCLLRWCVSGEQERMVPAPRSTHVCLLAGGIGIINIQSYYWKVCVHSCHFVGFIVFGFPHFLSWLVIILMWFSIFHGLPPHMYSRALSHSACGFFWFKKNFFCEYFLRSSFLYPYQKTD